MKSTYLLGITVRKMFATKKEQLTGQDKVRANILLL